MKRALIAISLILLVLFVLSIFGTVYYEQKVSVLYKEHTLLISKLALNRPEAVEQFVQSINLSKQQEILINIGSEGQKAVDFLTFGSPHCLNQKEKGCKVYTEDLVKSAQTRQKKVAEVLNKRIKDPIAEAQVYRWYELVMKAITLIIEGILLFIILLKTVLYLKARKWK